MPTAVRGIRISSPDRIIYPGLDFSKIDLVHYYDTVAEAMLPHVENRPLTLVHCPAGLQAPCNYMRHRRVWGRRGTEQGGHLGRGGATDHNDRLGR